MLGALDDGGRVDHLAARHVGVGGVHDLEAGGHGVSAVDDAAVDGGLAHLRGDLLDVGTVGDDARAGERGLVKAEVLQDLLRVLAHRHVGVAHGHLDVAGLEVGLEVVEALDALGVAGGHHERHLVLEDVEARVALDEVEALGVLALRVGRVELVHLLLAGGDEDVGLGALLDLGLEGARRVEVEGDLDAGLLRELLGRLLEALGEARRGEDLDLLAGVGRAGGGGGGGRHGVARAAAAGERRGHADGGDARDNRGPEPLEREPFHVRLPFLVLPFREVRGLAFVDTPRTRTC